MKKRKILYISGTRADYGLMKSALTSIKKHPKLEVEVAATGMHLMPEFGLTIEEIEDDGFKVHRVNAVYERDDKESMAAFVGRFIELLSKSIPKINPDMILVLGDRGEMLGGAIVGAYTSIPVAHVGGGEITSTVDELARHAITKLSHVHLCSTNKSAQRVVKMGEEKSNVFIIGAPGLDPILNQKLSTKEEIFKKLGLNPKKKVYLVIQHPVTIESENSERQMKETMEAVRELGEQAVIVYPNSDAGGRRMIKVIEEYRSYPFIHIYNNLLHDDYLSLMKYSSVMIGNSSSGIIEAPSFKLPVVEVGTRQEGRERAENVIAVGYDKTEIKNAVRKALSKPFQEKIKNIKNPYGDGKTGPRVAKILADAKIDEKLIQKTLNIKV
jgi:GDP/UDP-N,N'-diacetylbacillosamine 2-epimerase (hydrolysing)